MFIRCVYRFKHVASKILLDSEVPNKIDYIVAFIVYPNFDRIAN